MYRPALAFHSRELMAFFSAVALAVYSATRAGVPTLPSSQIISCSSS